MNMVAVMLAIMQIARLVSQGTGNMVLLVHVGDVDLNCYNFVLQRLCSILVLFLFSFSIIFVSFSLTVCGSWNQA